LKQNEYDENWDERKGSHREDCPPVRYGGGISKRAQRNRYSIYFRIVQVDQWGKEIVPAPVKSKDRRRDQSWFDQRQNDSKEYARLAASVNFSRLKARGLSTPRLS
jgi:hypothetical protein